MEIPVHTTTEYDIAKMIFEKYQTNYKYYNTKWYIKDVSKSEQSAQSANVDVVNNKWVQDNEKATYMIQIHILTYICEKYMDKIYENNKNISVINNLKENMYIVDMLKKLYTKTFQDKIIKECAEFYYDVNFAC